MMMVEGDCRLGRVGMFVPGEAREFDGNQMGKVGQVRQSGSGSRSQDGILLSPSEPATKAESCHQLAS